MKLLIAIPALNEEASIVSTIRRSLAARKPIISSSAVSEVAITVVSDGSTDRTVELASQFPEIDLIVFEKNRGYGAAIKEAWSAEMKNPPPTSAIARSTSWEEILEPTIAIAMTPMVLIATGSGGRAGGETAGP